MFCVESHRPVAFAAVTFLSDWLQVDSLFIGSRNEGEVASDGEGIAAAVKIYATRHRGMV